MLYFAMNIMARGVNMNQVEYVIVRWLAAIFILGLVTFPANADENYPGVYSNENRLVFVKGSSDLGGLEGIVILSWEYSMDWIITTGELAAKTDDSLIITDGHQYVYNADGSRRSESEFTSLIISIDWDEMGFHVLPSYGHYLAPMVHGGLAYALVEITSGLPNQLVLASEAYDSGQSINLFEGFLYQVSNGELTAQIAFTEVAFGSQGLVRGNFPEDFPPPPEDYPYPYPEYPEPSYPPPGNGSNTGTTNPEVYPTDPFNPSLPMGTPVEASEVDDRPRFTLEPVHDYDVPPITRLGVVAFQDHAGEWGYGPFCDEFLQTRLGEIEGLEVVYIPFDSSRFGGAVNYDRAVWLCEEHGVDALLLSEINQLEIPGGVTSAIAAGSVRVNSEISSILVEGTGGAEFWVGEFEADRIHEVYEVSSGEEPVLKGDLMFLINSMVDDLIGSTRLEGGYVE